MDEHQEKIKAIETFIEKATLHSCTINDLNDDCLRKIMECLPITDRIKIERGT